MLKRSHMNITGNVLSVLQEGGNEGAMISVIMRYANLAHQTTVTILRELSSSGLIVQFDGKTVITEKGIMFLDEWRQFQEMVESYGLEI